jgi:hypothetical protein
VKDEALIYGLFALDPRCRPLRLDSHNRDEYIVRDITYSLDDERFFQDWTSSVVSKNLVEVVFICSFGVTTGSHVCAKIRKVRNESQRTAQRKRCSLDQI